MMNPAQETARPRQPVVAQLEKLDKGSAGVRTKGGEQQVAQQVHTKARPRELVA